MPPLADYENPTTDRPHVMPTLRPGYREQGPTGMDNSRERITAVFDGSTLVEGLTVAAIAPHEGAQLPGVLLRFPSWDAVRPLDLVVETSAKGVSTATSRLHVDVRVKGRRPE